MAELAAAPAGSEADTPARTRRRPSAWSAAVAGSAILLVGALATFAVLWGTSTGSSSTVLAERSALEVELDLNVEERLTPAAEAAAYFVVSEALANVAKYARATSVTVRVAREPGAIAVEVADDGVGGANASKGSGLRGLADRIAALDGTLTVTSPEGDGTVVAARVPARPLPRGE